MWRRLMAAMQTGLSVGMASGMDAWRNGPPDPGIEQLQRRYAELEMLASGRLFTDYAKTMNWKNDPRVYKGISLLWNHTSRIPQFYGMLVYQGRLSTTPGQGAIPIVPDGSLTEGEVEQSRPRSSFRTPLDNAFPGTGGLHWRHPVRQRPSLCRQSAFWPLLLP